MDKVRLLNMRVMSMNSYFSEKVRNTARTLLASKAHEFGYSFEEFERSGRWILYEDLPKFGIIQEEKLPNIPEEMPKIASIDTFLNCPQCEKKFEKIRQNQRFCSTSCKVKFNNNKKKK